MPPLDVGVHAMSINQILKNEQITLMRYAAETDPIEVEKLRRKLNMFEHVLAAHPYSHRPYSLGNLAEGQPSLSLTATRTALSAWENEGGHA